MPEAPHSEATWWRTHVSHATSSPSRDCTEDSIRTLKRRARQAAGSEVVVWESGVLSPDDQERFWRRVVDWEAAPSTTDFERLIEAVRPRPALATVEPGRSAVAGETFSMPAFSAWRARDPAGPSPSRTGASSSAAPRQQCRARARPCWPNALSRETSEADADRPPAGRERLEVTSGSRAD